MKKKLKIFRCANFFFLKLKKKVICDQTTMPSKKKKGSKPSNQRPRAYVQGLTSISSSMSKGEASHAKKRQRRKSMEVLKKVEGMANTQNAKARRTRNRKEQMPFESLESVIEENERKKKEAAERASAKSRQEENGETQDVHKILLDKSTSIPTDVPMDNEATRVPISIEEKDARDIFHAFEDARRKRATNKEPKLIDDDAPPPADFGSVSIISSDNTRPWIETLQMLATVRAQNLPAEIQVEQNTRMPPSAKSASSSTVSQTKTINNVPQFGHNGEMNSVWLADPAAIIMYIQKLVNFSDVQTNESIRRALRRPKIADQNDPHLCTREHVDRVLCCPYGPFRMCAWGNRCIAKTRWSLLPKPLMEYVSPQQYNDLMSGHDSRSIGSANFCYICLLYNYNRAHHNARERGPSVAGVQPQFYHTVAPGEYNHHDMIENLTGAVDTPADTPMVNCSVTGFENCGGLVTALKKFSVHDYTVDSAKRVAVPDGNGETLTVFGLKETVTEFVKHASTKNDPEPLDPYIRLKHFITHRPDMWEIMQYYFSTSNRIPSIGISRLRNAHPQVKKEVVTVAIYWGVTSPHSHISTFASRLSASGFEPFPFQWIFCEDITETANHLKEILRGGRIHLAYLEGQEAYRKVMNHPVDFDTHLNVYSDAIQTHPFFSSRRLLAAFLIRTQVYATLLSMYPSNTPYNDASIHKRLTIMYQWNENQYGYLRDLEPLDTDVELQPIDPLPFHFFASDIDFYKVRTEIVCKSSPREYLVCQYPEHPVFMEFRDMRRALRDRKIEIKEAVNLWKRATSGTALYFEHPRIPDQLVDADMPDYILYELLCDQYTILWCLMVRLNYVGALVAEREAALVSLTSELRQLEDRYLSQSENESDRNTSAGARSRKRHKRRKITWEDVNKKKRDHDKQQEVVYQFYCYLYTHLPLAERSIDLNLTSDAEFFQKSPVIPSAEPVVLGREMQHYQGRKFSICEHPMQRLAELLTYLRSTKPKFVARVVKHYSHLFIHPVTGFVDIHRYQTVAKDRAFSIFYVTGKVDKSFVASLIEDKRPFYKVGETTPTTSVIPTHLNCLTVETFKGRKETIYEFTTERYGGGTHKKGVVGTTWIYVRDPEFSAHMAKARSEDNDLESDLPVNSYCVYRNGRLLDDTEANHKNLTHFHANTIKYVKFEGYSAFPRDPDTLDPFAENIQYQQSDLDVYFKEFLDGLVNCLNTACHSRERHLLAQFYIELIINENNMVKRVPVNFGPIRQVSNRRQFDILEDLLKEAPNQVITHYTECYPDDRRTVHEGMLPNITPIIGCINFVDDNSAEPKSNTRKPAAIIYMLRKMYPKCCQSRKKDEKHASACKDNISYLMLVRECFLVTMLGAYRHALKRPKFIKALGVYKMMRSHFNIERFFEDQKRFPSLFTFCVTEALVLWTRSTLAYYHYILSRYQIYTRFEQTVYVKADRIREDFGKGHSIASLDNYIDERELFATEPSTTSSSAIQQVKNHVYRRTCFNPIYKLRAYMGEILGKPKYRIRPEMPKILRKAIIHRVYSLEPNSDIDMISILGEFNAFHKTSHTPKIHELNIQPCTEVILYWVLRLMANAAPDDSIKELLELMPSKDMEVFDLFINTLARHYSVNIFRLPEFMRRQQELALKLRHGIHNPTVASGSLMITTCCNQKKTYDSREQSKSAHQHYGSRLMSLDTRDGYKVFCCSKKDADIERKNTRIRKELAREVERAVITGKSKTAISAIMNSRAPEWHAHASYRYQPKCGDSPAQIYSLVGYVVQIVDSRNITNAFTTCVSCGSVCGFSRRMYDINWFTCMTCEKEHILKMRTPRCVACRHFLKLDKNHGANWRQFMVFNDNQVPVTYSFDIFHICDRCYGTKTSYFRSDIIYTTSELRNAKYANEQRAIFDLREGNINVHEVIAHYQENFVIRLSNPNAGPNRSSLASNYDSSENCALKSNIASGSHLLTNKARRRQRLMRSGPERPYDTSGNYYGNFKSIDMHQGDNAAFSTFFSVLDNAIFPSSLTDADTFRLNNEIQSKSLH